MRLLIVSMIISLSGCAMTPETMNAINNSLNAINNQYRVEPAPNRYIPPKSNRGKCVPGTGCTVDR